MADLDPVHSLPTDATLFPAQRMTSRYQDLPSAFYSPVAPEAVGEDPILIHANRQSLSLIGLEPEAADEPVFLEVMAGHRLINGAAPYAAVYAGHQFGHFVPQLGDGRAVTVAEGTADGQLWELQLKGAGQTPYSRFGDGRAVMRSVIREYLCSEHMHALGIPTTRALSVLATREGVQRETIEPGAVMSRVAPSHIRFGHFEYFHHRNEPEHVKRLADHLIEHHFTELADYKVPYAALFKEVVERTARLIAQWQSVGFAHGVMNTDNMSILGQTIDYGPFGFLDRFDPGFICNHTDHTGRYAFAQQPAIGFWNLKALAVAMTSLVSMDELTAGLERYGPVFDETWTAAMRTKLGLEKQEAEDHQLAADFLKLLEKTEADYPTAWRALSRMAVERHSKPVSIPCAALESDWWEQWYTRLEREDAADLSARLDAANPKFVLRNWVAETAIRAVEDEFDLGVLDQIFRLVTNPFADHGEDDQKFSMPPPADLCGLAVSCSS